MHYSMDEKVQGHFLNGSSVNRLIVVIPIPCLLNGGTERQTLTMSKILAKAGYKVVIVCYFEYVSNIVSEFRNHGCRVILFGLSRKTHPAKLVLILRRAFRKLNPSIIHVQYISPGFLPILAARLAGCKRILSTIHQTGYQYGLFAHVLIRTSLMLSRKFIAVSLQTELSWFGDANLFDASNPALQQRRHFTIYNPIDIYELELIKKTSDPDQLKQKYSLQDRQIIGTISRLRSEKGVDLLVTAFIHIASKHPSVMLLIVGDGPEVQRIKEIAEKSGVSDRIRWIGETCWKEAIQLMDLLDIVIIPSRFEGFGLAAAEAMALGKVVIANDTGGLKEVVSDNQTGFLVNINDSARVSDLVLTLLDNPAERQRIGRNAEIMMNRNFTIENYTTQILHVYKNTGAYIL